MAVEVIGTIEPKNNGGFPVVRAQNVEVDEKRLPEVLNNLATKEDIDEANQKIENKAEKSTVESLSGVIATKADKTETEAKTSDLQTQINNIVTGVPAEAEVLQARAGADGTNHPTLKARLDVENNSLMKEIAKSEQRLSKFENDIAIVEYGKNLADSNYFYIGILTATGTINTSNTEYETTDFIQVIPNEKYSVASYGSSGYVAKTRTGYAYFDENRNIIASTFTSLDAVEGLVSTAPLNAAYIRAFSHTWNSGKIMVCKSEYVEQPFEPFSKTYYNNMIIKGYEDFKSKVENDLANIYEIERGQNLNDYTKQTEGFIKNSNGEINPLVGYNTTDFIRVSQGINYTIGGSANRTSSASSLTRHGGLFYDADKKPIQESYENTDGVSFVTVTAPENAAYLRAFTHNSFVIVVEGETLPSYYPDFSITYKNIMEIPELEEIDNRLKVVESRNDISDVEKSINLCDNRIPLVQGVLVSPNNWNSTGAYEFYWTQIVNIPEDGRYTWYSFKAPQFNNIYTNRKFTTIVHQDGTYTFENETGLASKTIEVVKGDTVYIATSVNTVSTEEKPVYMLVKGENVITPYEEYFERYTIKESVLNDSFVDNKLKNKKWVVCGDSFSNGSHSALLESGKYKNYRKVYPYFIGNRTGIEVVKFFESGKTLAYPADGSFTNSLTCPTSELYFQNIPEDADYITIYLGINDSNHRTGSGTTVDGEDATGVIPIGTVNDTDSSTYGGAWNVVLSWLIENRPFSHIGVIITNGTASVDYVNLQKSICEKYGIPYIDLNGDERTRAMIRPQNPKISDFVKRTLIAKQAVDPDGTKYGSVDLHPNDDAHEYESYIIEEFLKTI